MWRRLLSIPWTARRTNASVINKIQLKHSLETLDTISKLKYLGHTMPTSDSMEKNCGEMPPNIAFPSTPREHIEEFSFSVHELLCKILLM
jgi:hypothetical protein